MECLDTLELEENSLTELPDWFGDLKSLNYLDLDKNSHLTRLHPHVATLSMFRCYGCRNLTEPPYAVCEGGLGNIKQYYADLQASSDSITLLTVVLLGRKEAGKSTLLKAMQEKFCPKLIPVKKTKVFEFKEVTFQHLDQKVRVIDFGGDEVYHYAYQLACGRDCIPIVVVNLEEYEDLCRKWGPREATRRVAFDWLSHLLLVAPEVEKPLLALTHKDQIKADEKSAEAMKDEICETIEQLKNDLLNENSMMKDITMFRNKNPEGNSSQIFEDEHVLVLEYNTENRGKKVFSDLETILQNRISKSKQTVPGSWKTLMQNVQNDSNQAYLKRKAIKHPEMTLKVIDVVLGYMQRSKQIIRYEKAAALSDVIFHNIPAIASLIGSLFDYRMNDTVRVQHSVEEQTGDGANSYWCGGILREKDLEFRFPSGNDSIDFEVAKALLTCFKLIYGPITVNGIKECFLAPYFMRSHTFQSRSAEVQLVANLNFVGLKVPGYAFHQMSVAFLEALRPEADEMYPYGNGASARLKTQAHTESSDLAKEEEQAIADVHMIHMIEEQRVVLRVEGDASQINQMWRVLQRLLKALNAELKEVWSFTKVVHEVICPHCLLWKHENPALIDADLLIHGKILGPKETSSCSGEQDIPSALRVPGMFQPHGL